jgi:DNA polymerase III subunit delta'
MAKLLLHPHTEQALKRAKESDAHAFLLLASLGAGKATLLQLFAAELLDLTMDSIETSAAVKLIRPDKQTITIEQIRSLQAFIKLKMPGHAKVRRVIIVEDAQEMTIEAQNALLKALEEPPEDTILLLSAAPDTRLLPTILSRVQQIVIKSPSEADTVAHFVAQGHGESDVQRAYQIADGQTGLIAAILQNDTTHPLVSSIEIAKKLITQSSFERLTAVDDIVKHKETLQELLQALKRVYRSLLAGSVAKSHMAEIKRFNTSLKAIMDTEQALGKNASPKLALTDLFLHL